jgi:hypothetical protein
MSRDQPDTMLAKTTQTDGCQRLPRGATPTFGRPFDIINGSFGLPTRRLSRPRIIFRP